MELSKADQIDALRNLYTSLGWQVISERIQEDIDLYTKEVMMDTGLVLSDEERKRKILLVTYLNKLLTLPDQIAKEYMQESDTEGLDVYN